jgi:N-acetylneuraminate synthase
MIIAEIAQAHEGSLGILHSYIDALAAAGVDAVKFQTHIAEAESSPYEPFRVKFSYVDKTRFDYWKRMEFSLEQWMEIKAHCDAAGVGFISSPFSNAAVDLLEEVGMKRYKVGSGEITNLLLLKRLALTGKPVILSSGMSNLAELDTAVAYLKNAGTDVSVLQCTTAYPTVPQQWGLQVMGLLRDRYGIPVGFSDHSGTIAAGLAATALGAEILEFHAVFDRRMFGPDAPASLEIDEIAQLVKGVRAINESMAATVDKDDNSPFEQVKTIFGKSLSINKNLPAGHVLQFGDLEGKKPAGKGIAAASYEQVLGRALTRKMAQWEFLNEADLQ